MHPGPEHSDECNALAYSLAQCNKENRFKRFFGVCTKLDIELVDCLKRERASNRAANLEKAKERNAKYAKRAAELRDLRQERQ